MESINLVKIVDESNHANYIEIVLNEAAVLELEKNEGPHFNSINMWRLSYREKVSTEYVVFSQLFRCESNYRALHEGNKYVKNADINLW
jgi:hypothetical protein